MSMQPYQQSPIELRKQQVRKDSRSALVSVAGGVGGGVLLWAVLGSSFFLILGLVLAVGGGVYYGSRVRKAVNGGPTSEY